MSTSGEFWESGCAEDTGSDIESALCRYCQRDIVIDRDGRWIDPQATGDDSLWRETCDSHDTFTAEHHPH